MILSESHPEMTLFLLDYLPALLFCFCIHLNIHPSHASLYFISCSLDLSFFKAKRERELVVWILFQSDLSARILYPQSWNLLSVCLCVGAGLHFTNCTMILFSRPPRHRKQRNIYPAADLINGLKCYPIFHP